MAVGSISRSPDPRPHPYGTLRHAVRLLAIHPLVALGLGAALLLSLAAVCCGLGLVAAPWFVCELLALVLGAGLGRRMPRHAGWLGAGFVQAVAVVVVSVAVAVAVTWLGTELPTTPESPRPVEQNNAQLLLLAFGGSLVALLYMVPFIYAPALLIDRGGRIGVALIESARLVMRGGLLSHLGFSFVAHLLQVLPPVLAGGIALAVADPATVPVAVAVSLPVMAVTMPLGQGMVAASYLWRRRTPAESSAPASFLPKRLAFVLAGVGVAPAVALLLVAAAVIVRPSHPRPGEAPLGELVAGGSIEAPEQRLSIPYTALEVRAGPRRLAVVAGDGGGVGPVPLPDGAEVERVRVVRVRDAYAIEIASGSRSWTTWVDRAGVRLDDDLSARLADHLPPWGLLFLAGVMAAWAVVLGPVLARLVRGGRHERRGAWYAAAALLPVAAVVLGLGVHALVG